MYWHRGEVFIRKEDCKNLKDLPGYVWRRYEAVKLYSFKTQSWNNTDVAKHHKVSRRTLLRWVKRYKERGVLGLVKISKRPHHSPNKTPDDIEEKITLLRQATGLGGRELANLVNKSNKAEKRPERVSRRTAHRVLIRNGVLKGKKPKKHRFFEWKKPNQLIQTDITKIAGIPLLTSLDDFSRNLWVEVLTNETDGDVIRGLELLPKYENMLTDNGSQFSRYAEKIRKHCQDRRINHIWATVRHPETLGKLSRAQRGLKELIKTVGFSDIDDLKMKIAAYVKYANNGRYNRRTECYPAERYIGQTDESWYNEFVETFKLESILTKQRQV